MCGGGVCIFFHWNYCACWEESGYLKEWDRKTGVKGFCRVSGESFYFFFDMQEL